MQYTNNWESSEPPELMVCDPSRGGRGTGTGSRPRGNGRRRLAQSGSGDDTVTFDYEYDMDITSMMLYISQFAARDADGQSVTLDLDEMIYLTSQLIS